MRGTQGCNHLLSYKTNKSSYYQGSLNLKMYKALRVAAD
jgi:hypothetical protein